MNGAWLRWESDVDANLIHRTTATNSSFFWDTSGAKRDRNSGVLSTPGGLESTVAVSDDKSTIVLIEPDLDPDPDGAFARASTLLERIPEPISAFYASNEVDHFTFSRPIRKPIAGLSKNDPATEFLELWTEKTLLVTLDSFPCLNRRSEVIRAVVVELSPIQNAVIAVRSKNRQLVGLERKYEVMAFEALKIQAPQSALPFTAKRTSGNAPTPVRSMTDMTAGANTASRNVNLFTMALNGAVDAPVNGGVPMYRKAFLSETFKKENVSLAPLVKMLEDAIDEQVNIIHRCLGLHELIVPNQMRPLHENLISFFHKNFAAEIARLGIRRSGAFGGAPALKAIPPNRRSFSGAVPPVSSSFESVHSRMSTAPSMTTSNLYGMFGSSHTNLSSLIPSSSSVAPLGSISGQGTPRPRRESITGSVGTHLVGHVGMLAGSAGLTSSGSAGNLHALAVSDGNLTGSPIDGGSATSLASTPSGAAGNKRISMSSLKSNESRGSAGTGEGLAKTVTGGLQKLFEKW
ncbi:hypothetical protein HK101_007515 [Irineochytrium annulatum]|nr:hypothetical protein HK101_007515 [Irineochytrium annulatum]